MHNVVSDGDTCRQSTLERLGKAYPQDTYITPHLQLENIRNGKPSDNHFQGFQGKFVYLVGVGRRHMTVRGYVGVVVFRHAPVSGQFFTRHAVLPTCLDSILRGCLGYRSRSG